MRNTLYAVIAATLAMFATSGIIALATAAPAPERSHATAQEVDEELTRHLDILIEARLQRIKAKVIGELERSM